MSLTPEQIADLEKIKADVSMLLDAHNARMEQQIQTPIDEASRNVMLEGVPRKSEEFVAGSPTTNGSIKMKINGQEYNIMTTA
jgi:hypothetical protein